MFGCGHQWLRMIAILIDPAVIHRSVTAGKRFSIHAIDKFSTLMLGLNSSISKPGWWAFSAHAR